MDSEVLLEYTQKLTGLTPERVKAAQERLSSLSIPHVEAELVDLSTIDAAVAATLLSDSLDGLKAAGVEETKLLSKLRNDRDVWPVWAELHAANLLSRYLEPGTRITLEPGRSEGRQPDFHIASQAGPPFEFLPPETRRLSIEFKALGLSDDEAAFCSRARSTLNQFRPTAGFMTFHAPLGFAGAIKMNRAERREAAKHASRNVKQIPRHAQGMSGVVVRARGTEEQYVARLRARVKEALGQLPSDHDCCVAFHWSNGAPFHLITEAVTEAALPAHVRAVALIGSAVVFPYPDIHNFVSWGLVPTSGGGEIEFMSRLDDRIAKLVFDIVESSGGVRATVLRGALRGGGQQELLMRDGARRILPYVLLLDKDPTELADELRPSFDNHSLEDRGF